MSERRYATGGNTEHRMPASPPPADAPGFDADALRVFSVMHSGDYDDCNELVGVYATREEAEAARHWHMRARNKDGTVSFRTNDPRPKVRTLDGCDEIEEHILAAAPAPGLDVERTVRQTLAIVDQITPLSVGEPLVQRVLARLAGQEGGE